MQQAIEATAQNITDLEAAENGKISALDLRVTNAENAISFSVTDISDLKNGKLDKAVFIAYK